MKLSELGRMLEEAAGVEGRELSLGERQAQLEKYRFRFVNIYQELEMSSRFVDTHRDVSQGGDGVQLHSHTFYEMIYCTGGSTQYLLGTQRYRLRHGDIVLIPPGVSHRPLLAEKMADPYRRCVVWFSQEYVESVRPMWPELLKNQRFGVLRTANTRWEGMAKLFEAGCGEAARGAPGWQAVVCATTLELLVNIARALEDVDRSHASGGGAGPVRPSESFHRGAFGAGRYIGESGAGIFRQQKHHRPIVPQKAGHQLLPVSHAEPSHRGEGAHSGRRGPGKDLHGCGLRRLFHVLPGVPAGIRRRPV